jgi:polysaccharide biosynthesis protein PslH
MSFCIGSTTVQAANHVLFVAPYLPSPPKFGGQRRMHELMRGLARVRHVSLLTLVDPDDDPSEGLKATSEYCRRVVTVASRRTNASGARKRLAQLGSLLSRHSHGWLAHGGPTFSDALRAMLREERFDVVCVEFAQTMAALPARMGDPGARPVLCLDEHNIEFEIERRTARTTRDPVRRAYSAIDWRKLRADERRAWTAVDGCTLTSRRDEEKLLAELPAVPTAVVPNGVDLEHFRPTANPVGSDRPRLLFFGAIDYHPNTDGLLFFLKEIWPDVSRRNPRARLDIVGRRPPPAIESFRSPSVDVVGAVEDVRPWIGRASVVVVPLRIGGGTRLKVLEAMGMGKAIVSTTIGVEGLDVEHERDVLVADDAAEFSRSVGRVIAQPSLAARLGQVARSRVEAAYGWRASVDRLDAFHAELLAQRRGAA